MNDLQVVALFLLTAPIWSTTIIFGVTALFGWYMGERPPNLDFETYIEGVLFGYAHFIGKPVLMVGNLKWAKRIYGVANQRVYRTEDGYLAVTPEESSRSEEQYD